MNTWPDMTPEQQNAALAEKLGWASDVIYWRLPKGRLVHKKIESPTQSWEGMGLVVKAMVARGFMFEASVDALEAEALFCDVGIAGRGTANNLPAATAEAAWKALGGE